MAGKIFDDKKFKMRSEELEAWLHKHARDYIGDDDYTIIASSGRLTHKASLDDVVSGFDCGNNITYTGYKRLDNNMIVVFHPKENSTQLGYQVGPRLFEFSNFSALSISAYFADMIFDSDYLIHLVAIPSKYIEEWGRFEIEVRRINGTLSNDDNRVVIVGGHDGSFEPNVKWEDIILPDDLKNDVLDDIGGFFDKGVNIYKRLNLHPFRKILLAGVPGTGKTMLCSSLGKWAVDRGYLVIYVSGADRYGATFSKIHEALDVAHNTQKPALVIVEELDAYLQDVSERAQLLNVLDGSESPINEYGTYLITTTNYPEAIDSRIMKRPGRIDRIFIIPQIKTKETAIAILRHYMGEMWKDEFIDVAAELTGKPGAFVRELAIYILTQCANNNLTEVSMETVMAALIGLEEQVRITADFLEQSDRDMGFNANNSEATYKKPFGRDRIPFRRDGVIGPPLRQTGW